MRLVRNITSVALFQCKTHLTVQRISENISVHTNSMKIKISITPPVHWFCLPQTIFSTNSGLQGSFRILEYAAGKHKPEAKWVFRFYFIFLFQHVSANENMAAQSGGSRERKSCSSRRKLYLSPGVTSSPLTCYFPETDSWNITTTLTQRAQKRKKEKKKNNFHSLPFF